MQNIRNLEWKKVKYINDKELKQLTDYSFVISLFLLCLCGTTNILAHCMSVKDVSYDMMEEFSKKTNQFK